MSSNVISALSKSLHDENSNVRESAANALLKIGSVESLKVLESLLNDDNPELRDLASDLLKKSEPKEKKVPIWNQSYAKLESASPQQKMFYKYWVSQIEKGNFINLENNLSYIFVYLDSAIYRFVYNKDINSLLECFSRIENGYRNYDIQKYLISWKSDAYFYLGEYEKSLKIQCEIGFSIFDIIKYTRIITEKNENLMYGSFLINLRIKGLTILGIKHKDAIAPIITDILKKFKEEHEKNVYDYYLNSLKKFNNKKFENILSFLNSFYFGNLDEKSLHQLIDSLSEEDFELILNMDRKSSNRQIDLQKKTEDLDKEFLKKIKKLSSKDNYRFFKENYDNYGKMNDFVNHITINLGQVDKSDWKFLKNYCTIEELSHIFLGYYGIGLITTNGCICPEGIFNGVPNVHRLDETRLSSYYCDKLETVITDILRESENQFRKSKGIPRIGEGWVSETELYYAIKETFQNERVIHHGRPDWLGQQHLDVFFPERNIGIEYQGIQHDKPVDIFGGEEGFEYRKELDQRKKRLCKENNCKLLYVYPDYDFAEIEKKIINLLSKTEPET